MSFPIEGAYHGIATINDFENVERRRLGPTAFIFKANRNSGNGNTDECSISWADSNEALYMLADQVKFAEKIGSYRTLFHGGACRTPLERLESLKEKYPKCFDYNRDSMDYQGRFGMRKNGHHCNLLIMNADTNQVKKAKKNIVALLAWMTSPPQSDVYSREVLDSLLSEQ